MKIKSNWLGITSIVLGVIVIVFSLPHFLDWLVGIFLIANGIMALAKK